MKKIIISLVAVALLAPALSFASFWKADENTSITPAQSVQDNAYLAGTNVTVSGEVSGDLFAAGQNVSISGSIGRDIMAAGNMVNVNASKAEDARVAGSSVNLGGNFSGELLAAGAQVLANSDATIAKNVYLAGSSLVFNGKGGGDVSLYGDEVEVNGTVAGNLIVESGMALIIGPEAVIKGDLNYSSPVEAQIAPEAKITGAVNFEETSVRESIGRDGARGVFTVFFMGKLLAMLLAAYLIWYLRRKDAVEVIQQATSKFGASLLRGFVFMVVVPAAIVVLLFTLIGFPIAIFSGLLYAALMMLACPLSILFVSSLIMKKKIELRWYHILLGALVLSILKFIPLLGWLAVFLVYLASLGSMLLVLRAKFKR